MQFTERNEFFYASDKEARQYLTEIGRKISDGLSRQEIQEDDVLTTKNVIFINEAAGRVRMEINETIRKP
ncbi:MAG: hypothetical protein WBF04_20245 [Candidatus Sulfotelmatobacter sp.]